MKELVEDGGVKEGWTKTNEGVEVLFLFSGVLISHLASDPFFAPPVNRRSQL